ncbi:protein of unknown function [Brochothrix thermosphacta]|nr:hypothetical protein BTH160X_60080 [Brochothrix thermosphacta]SPN71550.1 protein of unknown function [Brochothrix thermosphacta]SPN76458.1 hypothetical protein BTEBP_70075 [Brochothrix thermosphacta]
MYCFLSSYHNNTNLKMEVIYEDVYARRLYVFTSVLIDTRNYNHFSYLFNQRSESSQ